MSASTRRIGVGTCVLAGTFVGLRPAFGHDDVSDECRAALDRTGPSFAVHWPETALTP